MRAALNLHRKQTVSAEPCALKINFIDLRRSAEETFSRQRQQQSTTRDLSLDGTFTIQNVIISRRHGAFPPLSSIIF